MANFIPKNPSRCPNLFQKLLWQPEKEQNEEKEQISKPQKSFFGNYLSLSDNYLTLYTSNWSTWPP